MFESRSWRAQVTNRGLATEPHSVTMVVSVRAAFGGSSPTKAIGMMRLTFVRHGETYNNRDSIVQGQDPHQGRLTDKGLRQAELLGKSLREVPYDVVYSSTLERCALTLGKILEQRPGTRTLPLVFAEELKEVHLGVLQGRPHAEWKASITGDPMSWRPPGGESWLDLQARVMGYVRSTILPAGQREVLVVAHGGVNRSVLAGFTGISMGQSWREAGVGTPQENTCVNILELDDEGRLVSCTVNDTRHLAPEFPEAGQGQRWIPAERRWELLNGRATGSKEFIPVG
jgi:broad specificity phosphatase PhoE